MKKKKPPFTHLPDAIFTTPKVIDVAEAQRRLDHLRAEMVLTGDLVNNMLGGKLNAEEFSRLTSLPLPLMKPAPSKKPDTLTGVPFDLIERALAEITVTTMVNAVPVDSPIRHAVTAAVESAYRRGLTEGQAAGNLMTDVSEDVARRRVDNLGHLTTVATMWALCANSLTIDKDDLQIAAWIVGASMFSATPDAAGGVTYDLDFETIEKGYEKFTKGETE